MRSHLDAALRPTGDLAYQQLRCVDRSALSCVARQAARLGVCRNTAVSVTPRPRFARVSTISGDILHIGDSHVGISQANPGYRLSHIEARESFAQRKTPTPFGIGV